MKQTYSKFFKSNRWFAVVHTNGQKFRNEKSVRRITVIVWTISAFISTYRVPLTDTMAVKSNENSTFFNNTNPTSVSNFTKKTFDGTESNKTTDDFSNTDYEKCMFFYGTYGMAETTKNVVSLVIETLGPLIGFVIPILIISFCYATIVFTVRRKTMETSSRAPVGRVAKLSTLVIIAFIFCWTPQKVLNIWAVFCG